MLVAKLKNLVGRVNKSFFFEAVFGNISPKKTMFLWCSNSPGSDRIRRFSLDSLVEGSQLGYQKQPNFSGQHWALLEMWFANFGLRSEQLPRTPRTSLMDLFFAKCRVWDWKNGRL